ncbi:hypothetical protein ACWCQK_33350 [Streptomyces sp. NPDC002306]
MTKRLSIALASVALAGGALLGTGGSASAATTSMPVQHAQYVSSVSVSAAEDLGRHNVTTVQWHEDQVAEATAAGHVVTTVQWHEDQVADAAASGHGITAARWYEDQVEWAQSHS